VAPLIVLPDDRALAAAAAERITSLVERAVAARGTAVLALTGGHTPRLLYQRLADPAYPWRTRTPWERIHVTWGDERCVPPDDPESNYGMAASLLLQHVPVPATHVHRMRGELPPEDAARDYDRTLRALGERVGLPPGASDVMLLGLGTDAHIASLFPHSPLLVGDTRERLADAVWAPHLQRWRITVTPRVILAAAAILVLTAGPAKANAVHEALEAPEDLPRAPGQLLRRAGSRVTWLVDAAAAARLPPGARPA
jgi:6-phosphogluconolactonase